MKPIYLPLKSLGQAAVAVLAWAFAMPLRAQTLGLAPTHDVSLWRVIGALLFCCLLGAAGALALRYRTRGSASGGRTGTTANWRQLVANFSIRTKPADEGASRLQLIRTVRLGYQVDVNLLECDGKTIVIVASPHGAFVANADAPRETGGAS